MPSLPTPDALQVAVMLGSAFLLYVAVVKAVVPIWRWFRNGAGWLGDLIAVVWGRKARLDRVTGEKHKAVPRLVDALVQISEKQDVQGKSIDNLTTVVTRVADQQITLDEHTKQIAELRLASGIQAQEIGLLKKATDERIEIRREQTALLNSIAERDTINVDPDAD